MRARLVAIAGVAGALCAGPVVAHAHSGGVNGGGCGCHGNGDVGIDVSVSPMSFDPGDEVTVTVTVSQAGGNVAGVFIDDDGVGSYDTISGQGLAEVAAGMTHTSPKSMNGGSASWSFDWTAPNEVGAVRFTVWGLSGNGNGSSSGDDAESEPFDFVFGCQPQEYYRDADGDGFGRTNSPLTHCQGSAPTGYAAESGDCDDNDPDQYPTAVEYCNTVDDDCDGEIDENAIPLTQYPDADGDGYYSQAEYESGESFVGCVPSDGWAAEPGDCRPEDPTIHPGVEEVCNGFDDNCDNDVDEFVRPRCGTGWCEREAIGCDPQHCTPGEPRVEECNFFDDDCDGIVDNDAPCPEGETCQAGLCRPEEEAETGGDEAGGDDDDDDDDDDAGPSDGTAGGTEGTAAAANDTPSSCACTNTPAQAPLAWLLLIPLARRRNQSLSTSGT